MLITPHLLLGAARKKPVLLMANDIGGTTANIALNANYTFAQGLSPLAREHILAFMGERLENLSTAPNVMEVAFDGDPQFSLGGHWFADGSEVATIAAGLAPGPMTTPEITFIEPDATGSFGAEKQEAGFTTFRLANMSEVVDVQRVGVRNQTYQSVTVNVKKGGMAMAVLQSTANDSANFSNAHTLHNLNLGGSRLTVGIAYGDLSQGGGLYGNFAADGTCTFTGGSAGYGGDAHVIMAVSVR